MPKIESKVWSASCKISD